MNSNYTGYTEAQLKRTLARMLPNTLGFNGKILLVRQGDILREVLDTELLHLCWMVEESLALDDNFNWQEYEDALNEQGVWKNTHSTWQQRVISLAKVKGVEIV